MSVRMGRAAVELIKQKLTILDALEQYAGIDVSGVRYNRVKFNVRCPFHDDRNPSMTIYMDTNRFRCWSGCNDGQAGDVIDVVSLTNGISKGEAIHHLTAALGIHADRLTVMKIEVQQRRRKKELGLRQLEKDRVSWAIDALSWLSGIIRSEQQHVKNETDLNRIYVLVYQLAYIEHNLDCLTDGSNQDKKEAVDWAIKTIKGVKNHAIVSVSAAAKL